MIVNDLKNKKTIDEKSGNYLVLVEDRPNENLELFTLFDQDKLIDFAVVCKIVSVGGGKMDIIRREVKSNFFEKNPEERDKYKKVLSSFFDVYGYYYGKKSEEVHKSIVEFI